MSTPQIRRSQWMGALALAGTDRLQGAWDALAAPPEYILVRGPETGLVMVRARSGNGGQRFNLGEMTVTRCSVSLQGGIMGHAWISGMRPDHARLAALFDAMLQDPRHSDELCRTLVEPLLLARKEHLARRAHEVRPSRVDFFTLVRGED